MRLYTKTSIFILFLLLINSLSSAGSNNGKELFKENCASCHEIGRILTGPDLQHITSIRTKDWLIALITDSKSLIDAGDEIANQLYEEYQKVEMPPSGLDTNEILALLDYIENYEFSKAVYQAYEQQQTTKKDFQLSVVSMVLFIILLLILLPLAFMKDLRKRIPSSFYLITSAFFFLILSLNARTIRQNKEVNNLLEIKQEVDFSHKIHYTDYQIDCIYCHEKALNSKTANLPAVSNCMKCHDYIREGEVFEKEKIAKLLKLINDKKEIKWKKAYRLSEHVHFNHGLHVNSAKIKCIDCHDNTENPMITKTNVSMKWCIDCHDNQSVNLDLNYYKSVYDTLYNSKGLNATRNGAANCSVCHY